MPPPTPHTPPTHSAQTNAAMVAIAALARETGLFGDVLATPTSVVANAANAADPAEYRVTVEGDKVWVSLVTAARYLSQSIEQTLVHSGDKAGDLLRDELIDVGLLTSHNDPAPDRGALPLAAP